MVKNLKEALQAYRQCRTKEEKEDVLYHVYDTTIVEEKNTYEKGADSIVQLRFKIDYMDKVHNYVNSKYKGISRRHLDEYVLVAVYKIFEEREINFNFSEKQIEKWYFQALVGLVNNQIKNNSKHGLTGVRSEELDEIIVLPQQLISKNDVQGDASLYDQVALRQYNDRHIKSSFDEFITEIGDYEKLLSKSQLEIFTLRNTGLTEQEVAVKLGCSQQNVNQTYTKALTRIHKKYIDFRLTKIASKSPNTITIIENHINNYNDIISCFILNKIELYKYTYKFLKDNYKLYNDFDDKSYTVFDVIFDNLKQNEHDLFRNVIASFKNNKISITGREKEKVVNIVNRILNKHVKNTYEAAGNITKDVTHNHNIVNKFYN